MHGTNTVKVCSLLNLQAFEYVFSTAIFFCYAVAVSEQSVQNPPFISPDQKRKNEQAD
jgi:hypothetical protein